MSRGLERWERGAGKEDEVTALQGLKSKAEPCEVEWEHSRRREGGQVGRPV